MRQKTLLLFVPFAFSVASSNLAEEYKISLQSNGEEIAAIDLSIDGEMAIVKVEDVTERFDLKNQRWQHDESQQWVTLSQCKTWAQQSKEKSIKSINSAPAPSRSFLKWSLDPEFEITSSEETLTFSSGQVDYKITFEKTDRDLTNYYRYARLNAYKKAMTERKLPPFAELKVLDELERRKLMPRSMEINIPGVPKAPSFQMVITDRPQ